LRSQFLRHLLLERRVLPQFVLQVMEFEQLEQV
jgi:hypothetical protein